MRIVSLLPSITEIVCALGLESSLVGRSHECDFPDGVQSLPACTRPKYVAQGSSTEIHHNVESLVREGLSIYEVDAELLASLKPDIILTQDHCEVCAASYSEVKKAVRQKLGDGVDILSVSPGNLDEVLLSIQQVAETLDAEDEGASLIKQIINRLNKIQGKTSTLPSPNIICIEWINPLMSAGNWFPDLVNIAGGNTLLGTSGEPSAWIDCKEIVAQNPDLLLISPCGYSLEKTAEEVSHLTSLEGWSELQAVQNNRVYLMEGHHYFHRPGPRLVDSAKILAEIFHPGIFDPDHKTKGWINYIDQ